MNVCVCACIRMHVCVNACLHVYVFVTQTPAYTCHVQAVWELSQLHISVQGLQNGTAKIAILQSYPCTKLLDLDSNPRAKALQKEYDETGEYKVGHVWGLPLDLVDQLGGTPNMATNDNNRGPVGAVGKFLEPAKDSTASQSAHTDGDINSAVEQPNFCGMLIPLTEDTTRVRIWPYTHDMMEMTKRAMTNVAHMMKQANKKDPTWNERIKNYVVANSEPGSILRMQRQIKPEYVVLCKGQSMAFLACLVHAGACISRLARRINNRLHVYTIFDDAHFDHGAAVVQTNLINHACENAWGGDRD
jgi:hypothetical protein